MQKRFVSAKNASMQQILTPFIVDTDNINKNFTDALLNPPNFSIVLKNIFNYRKVQTGCFFLVKNESTLITGGVETLNANFTPALVTTDFRNKNITLEAIIM